jgi:acetyl esterase
MRRLLPLLLLAACTAGPPQGRVAYQPSPAMDAQLVELQRLRPQPEPGLTPEEALHQPRLLDAARAIENVRGLPYPDLPVPRFQLIEAEGVTGPLPARLYQPKEANGTPLILLYAGGGFATPDLDAADLMARALVERTRDVVVVVGMRPAPGARFPADHNDALAVLGWAWKNAHTWGANPARLALGGTGTGALLALSTAIAARDAHAAMPAHLVLITPMAAPPTRNAWARARPRQLEDVRWDLRQYTGGVVPADPRLDPLHLADLHGLPPVTMVLAEGDPLRPDAKALLDRLRAAGVPVQARLYQGASAEFFPLGQKVPEAAGAEGFVADQLRAAFGTPAVKPTTPP